MPNEDLLAAISGAIDASSTAPVSKESDDETEDADLETGGEGTDESDDQPGDDAGGDESDEVSDGEGGEDEEEAPAETGAADGKKKPDGQAAKTPEQIAAEQAAAAKPKDLLNDPIDPRLKESTRERITGLIDIAKTVTAERDQIKAQHDEVMGYIQESKATPEQYGQALTYIGMVNSGDVKQMEQAWNFMMGEMQALGRLLGKEVPGVDYLANHPDLKQAVTAGQVTEAVAKETARLRETQQFQTQQRQQMTQQQQTQDQRNAILTQGRTELTNLGRELAQTDPNYARKAKILTASLKGTFQQIDPRMWAKAFKQAYDALEIPVTPAVKTVPTQKKSNLPNNQPLRGKTPAGGQQAAPKSMFEAIDNALSNI